jgi:hypothetical protein
MSTIFTVHISIGLLSSHQKYSVSPAYDILDFLYPISPDFSKYPPQTNSKGLRITRSTLITATTSLPGYLFSVLVTLFVTVTKHLRGQLYFGSQFQRFQFMVSELHCFWAMVRQGIVVGSREEQS